MRPIQRARGVLLGVVLTAAAAGLGRQAAGEDWPQWRGPNRDDVTPESSGYPAGWPPKRLWSRNVGRGCTSPILVGGKLYVMGWAGRASRRSRSPGTDTLYCFDARTGSELWKQSYACPHQGRVRTGDTGAYGGPSSTPTYDRSTGYLYTISIDGDLHCRDANRQGRLIWATNLYDKYKVRRRPDAGAGTRDYGYPTSVLIHGDLILVEVGAAEGTVMAFDKKTGLRRWRSQYNRPAGHTGGLVPMKVAGKDCIAVLTLNNLVIMRADKGHQGRTIGTYKWQTEFACNVATPAAVGSQVVVTSAYNNKLAALFEVSLTGLRRKWASRYYATVSSPVIHRDRVYTINNAIQCMDLATGRLKWRGGNVGYGSCVVTAGDSKIIAFGNGKLVLLDAAANEYRELSRLEGIVRGTCYPHLALSDGIIVCKDRNGDMVMLSVRPGDRPAVIARPDVPRPKPPDRPKPKGPDRPRPSAHDQPPAPRAKPLRRGGAPPKMAADWPGSRDALVFLWADAKRPNRITDAQGKLVRKCGVEPRGDARTDSHGAMQLGRGAFLARGADRALLDACRRTNQLGIEATITPDNVRQGGPARIVSFSTDPYHRNFTLCQERDQLLLRLRTPRTGINGMNPQTTLCRLTAGKPHHVIVSYEPGRLVCYLNGRRVMDTNRVTGDFSNWSDQHLLFGDEWKDHRHWAGRLQGLAIHNRVIGAKEAAKRCKLAGDRR